MTTGPFGALCWRRRCVGYAGLRIDRKRRDEVSDTDDEDVDNMDSGKGNELDEDESDLRVRVGCHCQFQDVLTYFIVSAASTK